MISSKTGSFGRRSVFSCLLLSFFLLLPVISICVISLNGTADIWAHLWNTVLFYYVENTFLLGIGTVLISVLLGTTAAWISSSYSFPGRSFFSWALLLPMVVPGYIFAYIYTDLFDYAGPIQIFLREVFSWSSPQDYWFPEIRSLGGAILVLSLGGYTYVYLMARIGFLEQCASCNNACRLLSRFRFFRLSLPMAAPMISLGGLLVFMETLGDFGVSEYFSVSTMSVGLYNTWLLGANPAMGSQIALILQVIAMVTWYLQYYRCGKFNRKSYERKEACVNRIKPSALIRTLCFFFCSALLCIGFILPVFILANYALNYGNLMNIEPVINTLSISLFTAFIALLVGLLLSCMHRFGGPFIGHLTNLTSLGYALPGIVAAFGVSYAFTRFDLLTEGFGSNFFFSGTLITLVFAYVFRFLALPYNSLNGSMLRIPKSVERAARIMGKSDTTIVRRLFLPMNWNGILVAYLFVFIEVAKELPITLLLRPFNFETLSTYVYQFASDEMIELAAAPALLIITICLFGVLFINLCMEKASEKSYMNVDARNKKNIFCLQ